MWLRAVWMVVIGVTHTRLEEKHSIGCFNKNFAAKSKWIICPSHLLNWDISLDAVQITYLSFRQYLWIKHSKEKIKSYVLEICIGLQFQTCIH
jgi:hypothetical protein